MPFLQPAVARPAKERCPGGFDPAGDCS
jgi:hypothetical protein